MKVYMKKLKILFYGNIWSHSGLTKTLVTLQQSKVLDIYFSAPTYGALASYGIKLDKFIIIPNRDQLKLGSNRYAAEATSDMDIVVDCMASAIPTIEEESLLYHISNKVKILHAAFDPALNGKHTPYVDAYFCSSLDVLRYTAPYNEFNELLFCLYNTIVPSITEPEHKKKIRRDLGIPEDAFVIGSTLADDTLNRAVMTEFVKIHPEVYYITTTLYGEIDRFGYSGIPSQFRCIGKIEPDEVNKMLSVFDIYLHTRTETFGSCVFEAFAAGIPVVARWTESNNAFAECIYPNAGYLASDGRLDIPKIISDCVAALSYAYKNYDESIHRSKIAKQRVERWFPDNILPQYERLFITLAIKNGLIDALEYSDYTSIPTSPSKNDLVKWVDEFRPEIEGKLSKVSFI